jgi:hypothetical protein
MDEQVNGILPVVLGSNHKLVQNATLLGLPCPEIWGAQFQQQLSLADLGHRELPSAGSRSPTVRFSMRKPYYLE